MEKRSRQKKGVGDIGNSASGYNLAKEDITYLTYAAETLRNLEAPGLLLVTQGKRGRPNIMTIGWACLGSLWGRPCLVVLVRPSRYSYRLLEESGEFTVNVLPRNLAEVAAYCGSVSGREQDKFAARALTAMPARQVRPPVVGECVIHYECRVIHYNDSRATTMPPNIVQLAYPDGDRHRLYYGEILAVYADPDASGRL